MQASIWLAQQKITNSSTTNDVTEKCHNTKIVMIMTVEVHDYSTRIHIWQEEADSCNCESTTGSTTTKQKHSQFVQLIFFMLAVPVTQTSTKATSA